MYHTLIPHTQQLPMDKSHDMLKTASLTEFTRQSFRGTVCKWSASALPSRSPLSFSLLFPLLIRLLLRLFLGTPAVLLLFFIHLFLIIDSMLIRLSWIGVDYIPWPCTDEQGDTMKHCCEQLRQAVSGGEITKPRKNGDLVVPTKEICHGET